MDIPISIKRELQFLRTDLDKSIPKSTKSNVLIATWNLRQFGDLTEKLIANQNDSPKRDLQSLLCITEIICRFDIIALQEVKGNIKALRHLMKLLGDNWEFILTDVTQGKPGNSERLTFLFNKKKVSVSGLACELVLSKEQLDKNISVDALSNQFARTPYAVSFRVANKTFILLTLHVIYGDNEKPRIKELASIADWISSWTEELNNWDHNLITLGDFNIERAGDEAYQAFISKGLFVPPDLQGVQRMISGKGQFFDQIAWFNDQNQSPATSLTYNQGNSYNFKDKVLISRAYTTSELSYRISDHLPLWVEFIL